ncbi:hypothetical protein D3C80_1144920 [compost metagenome]
MQRHLGFITGRLEQRLGVGPGGEHVAGLHGQQVADRRLAERRLDGLHEVQQPHRAAVADVVEAIRRRAGVGLPPPVRVADRRPIRDPHYPLHDVVDMGEVPAELALVVDVDGLVAQDGAHELEQRHVGATPGAIDGEEAQARGGQAVEVGVGVGHQLVGLLARRVEGDGVIHPVRGLERHLLVQAVHRAGRGVDQVLDPVMATPLQHGQGAGEIAVGIGKRVVQ